MARQNDNASGIQQGVFSKKKKLLLCTRIRKMIYY